MVPNVLTAKKIPFGKVISVKNVSTINFRVGTNQNVYHALVLKSCLKVNVPL